MRLIEFTLCAAILCLFSTSASAEGPLRNSEKLNAPIKEQSAAVDPWAEFLMLSTGAAAGSFLGGLAFAVGGMGSELFGEYYGKPGASVISLSSPSSPPYRYRRRVP